MSPRVLGALTRAARFARRQPVLAGVIGLLGIGAAVVIVHMVTARAYRLDVNWGDGKHLEFAPAAVPSR